MIAKYTTTLYTHGNGSGSVHPGKCECVKSMPTQHTISTPYTLLANSALRETQTTIPPSVIWLKSSMAGSAAQIAEKMAGSTTTEDPLDALLAKLMLGAPQDHNHGRMISVGDDDDECDGDGDGKPQRKSNVARASGTVDSDEHDPWKVLSDQVNCHTQRERIACLRRPAGCTTVQ